MAWATAAAYAADRALKSAVVKTRDRSADGIIANESGPVIVPMNGQPKNCIVEIVTSENQLLRSSFDSNPANHCPNRQSANTPLTALRVIAKSQVPTTSG